MTWEFILRNKLVKSFIEKAEKAKFCYIAYSCDEYELPIAFGYSLYELSLVLLEPYSAVLKIYERRFVNEHRKYYIEKVFFD